MGQLTYLGMLLPWALPIIALQWVIGRSTLWRRLPIIAVTVAITTAYLSAADAVAISQGIWTIHGDRIIRLRLGAVPVEEILFFLLTNLMVVQSIVLLNAPEMRVLLRRLGRHTARR